MEVYYLIDIIISIIFFRACKRIQKIQGFGERFIKTTPFLPGKVFAHFNRASGIGHRASGIGHRASGNRASGIGHRASGIGHRALGFGRRAWRGGATAKFDFGG
jgi:hypothetical protein